MPRRGTSLDYTNKQVAFIVAPKTKNLLKTTDEIQLPTEILVLYTV